jgi:hypothetical protein
MQDLTLLVFTGICLVSGLLIFSLFYWAVAGLYKLFVKPFVVLGGRIYYSVTGTVKAEKVEKLTVHVYK